MPQGVEIITGFVTAPGATLTAWTMAAGNSLTIRNGILGKRIHLLDMWAFNQVAGTLRVRSPRLHDNVQGIRYQITANSVLPKLPYMFTQPLIPQDTLIAEQSGSAVGGQIETGALLVYYEDLPGVAGRFIHPAELMKRGVNMEPVEVTNTAGVAGGYSGQVAINSSFDNLKANTDYALVGGIVKTQCAVARIQGVDTGNLGVGFPGEPTLHHVTRDYFVRLSHFFNLPLIPVFNSANKGAILADVAQNQAGAAVTVNWNFVELAKG